MQKRLKRNIARIERVSGDFARRINAKPGLTNGHSDNP
jgi:hypothetical protein